MTEVTLRLQFDHPSRSLARSPESTARYAKQDCLCEAVSIGQAGLQEHFASRLLGHGRLSWRVVGVLVAKGRLQEEWSSKTRVRLLQFG